MDRDERFLVYSADVATRPRRQVMRHMLGGKNFGLITTRATKDGWDCSVSDTLTGHKALAAYDINSLFPLYLYPDDAASHLFNGHEDDGANAFNLSPGFLADAVNR